MEGAVKNSLDLIHVNLKAELEQEKMHRKLMEKELSDLKKTILEVDSNYIRDLQVTFYCLKIK